MTTDPSSGETDVAVRYSVRSGHVIVLASLTVQATGTLSAPSTQYAATSASVGYVVTIYTIRNVVAITPRVQALSWDDANHVQNATFACTDTVTGLPPGWNDYGVDWSSDAGANFPFDQPHNPTTNGHARVPGQVKVTATAHLHTDDGQSVDLPGSDACAAFGGPITFSIVTGSLATWNHDANGGKDSPWYLQNFYDHTASISNTMQKQQTGGVTMLNQPDTTTATWTLPAFLYTASPISGVPATNVINVTADAVGNDAVTCAIHIHWLDPTASTPTKPVYVDADGTDDTAATKFNANGTWTNYTNHFHSHRPMSDTGLTWQPAANQPSRPTQLPNGNPFPADAAWGQTDYTMTLVDTEGGGMPDVWVQERFIPVEPPAGFDTNYKTGYVWTSQERPPGVLSGVDHVGYYWLQPASSWQTVQFTHIYYAATNDAKSGDTEGIKVGQATMTFIPVAPPATSSATQQ